MTPTISIVIPTLNGGSLFAAVLEKLRMQQIPAEAGRSVGGGSQSDAMEIVIIDSGSTDNTVAIAEAAGAKVLKISPAEFDHGLTRNLGIEMTTGDIVMLMTQDALPADEQLIANLLRPFEDPLTAGAFARQIPRPEHDVLVARNIQSWIAGSPTRRVSHITDRAAYDAMPPMDKYFFCVFDNVCSAIRRKAWQTVPFRPNAFGEDIDWSKRALEAGWKIVYEPSASVIHSHDRPAGYEYKRTYMCHQTLFRLFGLSTIPAGSYVPRCFFTSVMQDWSHVWRHQRPVGRKLSLLTRVPFLSAGSVLGQYCGARNARRGQLKRIAGV